MLLLTILGIFLSIYCQLGDGALVTYFQHADFRGEQSTLDVVPGYCYNFGHWNDRISSINTRGSCVRVFLDSNCHGASYRIAPGTDCHSNLGQCGMNDKASSIQAC